MTAIIARKQTGVRVNTDQYQALRQLRETSGRSVTWMIQEAIRRYIAQERGQQPR